MNWQWQSGLIALLLDDLLKLISIRAGSVLRPEYGRVFGYICAFVDQMCKCIFVCICVCLHERLCKVKGRRQKNKKEP